MIGFHDRLLRLASPPGRYSHIIYKGCMLGGGNVYVSIIPLLYNIVPYCCWLHRLDANVSPPPNILNFGNETFLAAITPHGIIRGTAISSLRLIS